MLRDGSIYRLFMDLPLHVKPVELNIMPAREDDNCVFSEAMKDVKKLNYRINRVNRETNVQRIILMEGESADKKLRKTLQNDYEFTVSNLPEYIEEYIEGINPFIMEKLRSGDFSIQKSLDLHGYDTKTAQVAFEKLYRKLFYMEGIVSE